MCVIVSACMAFVVRCPRRFFALANLYACFYVIYMGEKLTKDIPVKPLTEIRYLKYHITI